jgi:hypothetical protein
LKKRQAKDIYERIYVESKKEYNCWKDEKIIAEYVFDFFYH